MYIYIYIYICIYIYTYREREVSALHRHTLRGQKMALNVRLLS